MIHSIIPPELILQQPVAQESLPPRTYQHIGGMLVEVQNSVQGRQISRLITTDPKCYLERRFAPGEPI